VANDLVARHGNQRQEIIAVPPQSIHQICLQELPKSPRIHLMDYLNVLWLFFADFDHLLIILGLFNIEDLVLKASPRSRHAGVNVEWLCR
jgi:hypothetical protein